MTKPHVHELTGLKPDALATYLAALGVIRVLAEQRDASARGFWRDEHFVLVTELSWEEVQRFFLEDYEPTPILAPWNLESGFFSLKGTDGSVGTDEAEAATSGSDENTDEEEIDNAATGDSEGDGGDEQEDDADSVSDPLLDRIANSKAPRFASFRRAIVVAREAIPLALRRAEDDSRRARVEMLHQLAEARAQYETREKFIEATDAVAKAKAEVEAWQAEAKETKKGAPVREAVAQARRRLKEAQQRLKDEEKELSKTLNDRKKKLNAPIEEAKNHFKAIQSSTKARLIADLRARWGEETQQWVDAAIVLDEKGEAGFTSILGSGGNDGRMEFTKNFRQHIHALFELETGNSLEAAGDRLRAALFGATTNLLLNKAVGQFFPGRAGGTNMGAGFFGGAAVNPWEFVLMLEGAIALVAGMSRRGDMGRARVSSPFWVEAASAGFGSASELEGSPRGEQWLPLWGHPLEYGELVELIREGRAQVGRLQTTRAGDLIRAAARLGLARGIESLQRFAYLERNGQSNLAVSAGRFRVASRSHQALLEEVAPWIDRLVWYSKRTKDNNVPLSLGAVARRAQESLFAVCRHDASPTEWCELLVALGDAEFALLRSGKNPARRPLPRLSWGWIAAADDGTSLGRTVLRLALSLASQHRPPGNDGIAIQDSIRGHFLPLDESNREWPRFRLDDRGRAERDPELVCTGRDLVTDAIALVRRRSIWARTSAPDRDRAPQLPLWAAGACEATLEEIGAWVRGDVSDDAVYELARPLLALDWDAIHKGQLGSQLPAVPGGVPEPLHMLLRLAHLPFDISIKGPNGRPEVAVTVRLDPEPLRRLAAGDLDGALRVVVRRLSASGLRPVFRRGVTRPGLVRRLAASLAFPVSQAGAARAARLVCKPYENLEPEEHLAAQG